MLAASRVADCLAAVNHSTCDNCAAVAYTLTPKLVSTHSKHVYNNYLPCTVQSLPANYIVIVDI